MASLTPLDKKKLEHIFDMKGGFVLDFSNPKFEEFFRSVAGINIYQDKYASYGDSKAKRLRTFWELEPDHLVGKVLKEILGIWKYNNQVAGTPIPSATYNEYLEITDRLLGIKSEPVITAEDQFLKVDFGKVHWDKLDIEPTIIPILESRLNEAHINFKNGAFLSTIFMAGSILEGLLIGTASKNPKDFNTANSSPKNKESKVKQFHEWTLAEFIDVAYEVDRIGLDIKKFSHALRDFRNYIHPYQQLSTGFNPDEHTARISMQVLSAALASLSGQRN